MLDPGVVGSPTDVATLVMSGFILYRLRDGQDAGHAVAVAISEVVPGVDEDDVRADLDVAPHESAKYLTDGGPRDE